MSSERGSFAYEGLDRVMHERARLGILSCMSSSEVALTFRDLKELCDLTDGNLSRHMKTLVEADLVIAERDDGEGRPQSIYCLSRTGRTRFLGYLAELERVVADAAPARSALGRRRPRPRADGAGA